METFRMLRVGNRIINLSQVAFAEYSAPGSAASEAEAGSGAATTGRTAEFSPATLVVHFVGGGEARFYQKDAEELNGHFDLLV